VELSRRTVLRLGAGGALFWVTGCGDEPTGPLFDPYEGLEPPNFTVPEVADLVRTDWSGDPWARGSYSFLPVGATPEDRATLRRPVAGRVFFAGEATDPDNPATVHGAQASGRRVADDVAQVASAGERVLVVGAGLAGLTAATALDAAGFDVTVLEARDRTGGRLDTVEPAGWGIPVERGASWVHDTDASDLPAQLDGLGIDTVAFDYANVVLGLDRERLDDDPFGDAAADAVESALAWAADQDEDRSLADALQESGAADDVEPGELEFHLDTEVVTEYGAGAEELSATWGLDEGTEGDDLLVTGGYSRLADALAEGLDVRLSQPIDRIALDDDTVTVHRADGTELAAGRVVVTVPLGVLQAGSIEFEPALPVGHRDAIARLGMGLLDKYWFRFDEVFWEEDALMWTKVAPADDRDPFRAWFNLAPATGEPVLLALLGGDAARTWASKTDAEVKAAAMESLQDFVGAGW
jgi:monoamine oxidase